MTTQLLIPKLKDVPETMSPFVVKNSKWNPVLKNYNAEFK